MAHDDDIDTLTDIFNNLNGTNVLFLSMCTTGIPPTDNIYPDYTDNDLYLESRILHIGWCFCENFSNDYNVDDIKSMIRKPINFKNTMNSTHGQDIIFEKAQKEGILIKIIFNGDFGSQLLDCDYILSFDAHLYVGILANEIHRIKNESLYNKILQLKDNNIICTKKLYEKFNGYEIDQTDIYKYLFKIDPPCQHNPKNNILAMLQILKYMITYTHTHTQQDENIKTVTLSKHTMNASVTKHPRTISGYESLTEKQQKKTMAGSGWNKEEEEQLINMFVNNKNSIKEIALAHKRTTGATRARLKKLDLLQDKTASNGSVKTIKDKQKKKNNKKKINVIDTDEIDDDNYNQDNDTDESDDIYTENILANKNRKNIMDNKKNEKDECDENDSELKQFLNSKKISTQTLFSKKHNTDSIY